MAHGGHFRPDVPRNDLYKFEREHADRERKPHQHGKTTTAKWHCSIFVCVDVNFVL